MFYNMRNTYILTEGPYFLGNVLVGVRVVFLPMGFFFFSGPIF